jgi:hypothetical protein
MASTVAGELRDSLASAALRIGVGNLFLIFWRI